MRVFVLNYKGKSIISLLIKFFTWGKYSHTALSNDAGRVIEAWHIGGVQEHINPWVIHKEGTEIDVYGIVQLHSIDAEDIWEYARTFKGMKYDFRSLFGFLPFLRWLWKNDLKKWFCSQLTVVILKHFYIFLFNSTWPLYKVSPTSVGSSVAIEKLGTATNFNEYLVIVNKELK